MTSLPTKASDRMPCSQNATFFGPEPESEGERLRGETIANHLAHYFAQYGWNTEEPDCWRDSGFAFSMKREEDALQLIIAPYYGKTDRWILQIAPSRLPGIIRRWFGSVPSASPERVFRTAIETQQVLGEHGFTDFKWCWDGLPEDDHCHAQPPRPCP